MSDKKAKTNIKDGNREAASAGRPETVLKKTIYDILPPTAVAVTLAALVVYTLFFLNHLMHSDMAAEVILSKLLRDEGKLVTDSWYYSTEIRILYSQLVMTPLFYLFSDFHTVKVLSIFIYLVLLLVFFYFLAKRFEFSKPAYFIALLLLLAPWSNEYLDMMFLGNFYTSQTICMYIFLALMIPAGSVLLCCDKEYDNMTVSVDKDKPGKDRPGKDKSERNKTLKWVRFILMALFSVLLGLSGMRYLACLFAPLFLAFGWELMNYRVLDGIQTPDVGKSRQDMSGADRSGNVVRDRGAVIKESLPTANSATEHNLVVGKESKGRYGIVFCRLMETGIYTVFALAGFLIHKFYLSTHYSFDNTSEVSFVPLSEVPGRISKALYQMVEFFGYRDGVTVVSPLGIVNVIKFFFFIAFITMIVKLVKDRAKLSQTERVFLYYFLFLFIINLYMLIFTDVLMQYRYWIPVFITGVILVGVYCHHYILKKTIICYLAVLFICGAALISLYGELWQDVKYDDCAKRQGYMEFLEKEGYDFGYATFWNGPVTEYLSNGKIHVGDFTADENGNIVPYEWLTQKAYYRQGYHKGKTFLLLARTEEAGMLKGEFEVLDDPVKVYEDDYYAVYEGEGMSLFSETN